MTAGMLIIGAGECGARAALTLREQGYDGPVTLLGDEPHLPYERPPLSKGSMVSEAEPVPKLIGDRQYFADRKIGCDRRTRSRDRPRGAIRHLRRSSNVFL
jgi:3-phenylpropionate/trans-cinnamate dioxygenase ferredoxin reductase component